ncbi:MAG: type II secretion system protein [Verrucomicrobiota bacterium]
MKTNARHGFSLIELMIVITILGVVVSLVIPAFGYSESNAKEDAHTAEMRAIQTAFVHYFYDNCPERDEGEALHAISYYGLYPLCTTEGIENLDTDPISSSGGSVTAKDAVQSNYDAANCIGWNGAYLLHEGWKDIDASVVGQPESGASDAEHVPVVYDPYGGYYRVLIPDDGTSQHPRLITLVCTGPNNILETAPTDIDAYKQIYPVGDDIVLRLLP